MKEQIINVRNLISYLIIYYLIKRFSIKPIILKLIKLMKKPLALLKYANFPTNHTIQSRLDPCLSNEHQLGSFCRILNENTMELREKKGPQKCRGEGGLLYPLGGALCVTTTDLDPSFSLVHSLSIPWIPLNAWLDAFIKAPPENHYFAEGGFL